MSDKMTTAWWSLRIAFFLGFLLAGVDKFFHRLANWDQYLSPMAQRGMGSHSHQFVWVAGALEVSIALLVITSWTRPGAYLASLWLLLNAINLVATGQYFDIALLDLGLCLAAFGLAKLTEAFDAEVLHVVPMEIRRAA